MHTGAELTGNVVFAYIVTVVLQWAKTSKYVPWITHERATLLRWLSAALAACASLGVHGAFNAGVDGGQLVIGGLSWVALRGHAWDWVTQFVAQQMTYHGVVKPGVKIDDATVAVVHPSTGVKA